MLVLQGTTPEEVRQSVIELCQSEAERYKRDGKNARLKRDKVADDARVSAMHVLIDLLTHCNLADLKADQARRDDEWAFAMKLKEGE